MPDNHQIDTIFREKLDHHEAPPPFRVWDQVASELPHTPAPVPYKMSYFLSGVAATLLFMGVVWYFNVPILPPNANQPIYPLDTHRTTTTTDFPHSINDSIAVPIQHFVSNEHHQENNQTINNSGSTNQKQQLLTPKFVKTNDVVGINPQKLVKNSQKESSSKTVHKTTASFDYVSPIKTENEQKLLITKPDLAQPTSKNNELSVSKKSPQITQVVPSIPETVTTSKTAPTITKQEENLLLQSGRISPVSAKSIPNFIEQPTRTPIAFPPATQLVVDEKHNLLSASKVATPVTTTKQQTPIVATPISVTTSNTPSLKAKKAEVVTAATKQQIPIMASATPIVATPIIATPTVTPVLPPHELPYLTPSTAQADPLPPSTSLYFPEVKMPKGLHLGAFGTINNTWILSPETLAKNPDGNLVHKLDFGTAYGLSGGFDFTEHFGLQLEWVINSTQGQKFDNFRPSTKLQKSEPAANQVNLRYTQVPVLLKYRFNRLSARTQQPISISTALGLQYSRLKSSSSEVNSHSFNHDVMQVHNWGWVAGIDMDLYVTPNYFFSLGLRGSVTAAGRAFIPTPQTTNHLLIGVRVGMSYRMSE